MLVTQGRTREDAAMPRKKDDDQAPPALAPRYLKLEDVASYLSVSVPQVYSLVRGGSCRPSSLAVAAFGASIAPSWTPT